MADGNTDSMADDTVTFKVKTSGDKTHSITMAQSATVAQLKEKLAGTDFEDIPIERQRLIYSGRVMKNEEPLSTYKIKTGNTVHLVKSAASNPTPQPPASSTSTPAAPQVPQNMSAGTSAGNLLAGLTGARYAGLTNLPSASAFGPDGGMTGLGGVSEDELARMMDDPATMQHMNEMMNSDAFLQMIEQHPNFRDNPQALAMIRNPEMRRLMFNPQTMRLASQLQRQQRQASGSASAFPMPGATDNTPSDATTGAGGSANANPSGNPPPYNPFGSPMFPGFGAGAGGAGGADANANPFGAFFNPFAMQPPNTAGATAPGQSQGNDSSNTTTGSNPAGSPAPPANPFASLFGGPGGANPLAGMPPPNPEHLQQFMQAMMGGNAGGAPAPQDDRPPEERYADQLRQLNDMGFYDFDRNVAALRRSGGSVQGAIEHLLG
ncbi:hypothetical protein Micbo1qcDRAFT_190436 [Microdochium bolleyi]|uniref:Uncharacterized protein n=1 Tax=Microdochium bolleyi TaxID=196109 RepID=A0A136IQG2_9PEZI|nr:hypothetical protein Micbo1qcDRAFT_190436 [Microdochium bolleyi]